MKLRLPKTRRFRVYIYIVSTALILFAIDLILIRIGRHITIAPDTTRITSPLRSDGTPDYLAAINTQYGAGITPENNAAPLILAAIGPKQLVPETSADLYARLSMPPLPADGDYFIPYHEYLQKQNRAVKLDAEKSWPQVDVAMRRAWQAKDNPKLAAWLESQAHPLALVHEATRRPRYFMPLLSRSRDSGNLVSAGLPPLGMMRALSESMRARAMLRAGEGDFAAARTDLLAIHRLARLVAQGPSLIGLLVAFAIDTDALDGERTVAAAESFTPEMARQLLADINSLPPFPDVAEKINMTERYTVLDAMVSAAGKRPSLSIPPGTDEPLTTSRRLALDYTPPNFNAALRLANSFLDGCIDACKAATFADRRAKSIAAERALDDFTRSVRKDRFVDPASLILSHFCSSIGNVHVLSDTRRMNVDLTRTALALGAYHADLHSYPDSLSALAPTYLPAIPLDLFIDKPLHYQVTPTGYLLYALGRNMTNDNGLGREHKDSTRPPTDDLSVLVGTFPITRPAK